jgi:Sec-independent protein translocase protein TatA
MFDFSLAELGIIGVVALMVLGPAEMLQLLKYARKFTAAAKREYEKYFTELQDAVGETDLITIVFDDEGNPQRAYDLEKLKPVIRGKEDEQRKTA